MHVRPLERATDFAPQNAIFVYFGLGVEAWMKIGMHLFSGEHADRGRQQAIDGTPQIRRRDGVGDSKGRYLFQRMYAGIGSARPGHMHALAFHAGKDLFQDALNGWQAGLNLPPMKTAAIVGQLDPDAAHQSGREPGFRTGMPRWHIGQSSGEWAATSSVASATRGTPTSARRPRREWLR